MEVAQQALSSVVEVWEASNDGANEIRNDSLEEVEDDAERLTKQRVGEETARAKDSVDHGAVGSNKLL